uniref:Uncharacterized protein n=1 Tax=Aegilops tauschii subsp. strangulata TaxID=200361 RepID=A0A453FRM8_AEGTS
MITLVFWSSRTKTLSGQYAYCAVAKYSLRPEILVGEMGVSRRILVLVASIFIYLGDE